MYLRADLQNRADAFSFVSRNKPCQSCLRKIRSSLFSLLPDWQQGVALHRWQRVIDDVGEGPEGVAGDERVRVGTGDSGPREVHLLGEKKNVNY